MSKNNTNARKHFAKLLDRRGEGVVHFGRYKCSHNATVQGVPKYRQIAISGANNGQFETGAGMSTGSGQSSMKDKLGAIVPKGGTSDKRKCGQIMSSNANTNRVTPKSIKRRLTIQRADLSCKKGLLKGKKQ